MNDELTPSGGISVTESAGSESQRKRRLSFSLRDLMLLTLIVGTWLPANLAWRKIPSLKNEVEQMRAMTDHLPVLDRDQLCVRTLPGIWHDLKGWKYYLPEQASMELRLATDRINKLGDPPECESAELPAGVHTIHLKHTYDTGGGNLTTVYIDDRVVIHREHPAGWLQSNGATSSGNASSSTSVHATDQKFVLHRMQYSPSHPQRKYFSSSVPSGYDAQGVQLWIAPRDQPLTPAPSFVSADSPIYPDRWGHRQGLRVQAPSGTPQNGLLMIEPDAYMVLNDRHSLGTREAVSGLSVRPVTDGNPDGERPEDVGGTPSFRPNRLTIEIKAAPQDDSLPLGADNAEGAISTDGKSVRWFAHYDNFPSGAKPIIELIFDSDHPHRIGLLPHQAADSTSMEAIELVTLFGQLLQWRNIALTANQRNDESPADRSSPWDDLPFTSLDSDDKQTDRWINVPLSRLPVTEGDSEQSRFKRIRITSTVKNFSDAQWPPNLPERWKYGGLPLKQTWYLPDGESGIRVRLRSSSEYPGTQVRVPGGAVIEQIAVRLPIPMERPVWLEFDSADRAEPATGRKPRRLRKPDRRR